MSTLYYTIPKFFEQRMGEHSCVRSFTRLNIQDEYIYRIDRTMGRSPLNVFLSDAYSFGHAEYLGKPDEVKKGDFILIARPEAGFDPAVMYLRAKKDGIGIGAIGKLMGALNLEDVSKYRTAEEKENERKMYGV